MEKYNRVPPDESEDAENTESSEENLFDEILADEEDGITMYEKLIELCDEPKKKKVYEEILADEKRHIEMLNKIKE